jgi:hypothetical protein
MAFSKFSIFSGSIPDSHPGKPPKNYSRLGDFGRGYDPIFTAADDTSSRAAADNEPRASVTKIPTDAQSLRQAIDDTSRANGTPVFRSGGAVVGILDGQVTRTGENEWTLRDGTLGVFDGERAYGQRHQGFDVIIRQDPQTGAISIDDK